MRWLRRLFGADDHHAEEQRRRAELLMRATKAGLLEWDAVSGVITYSDRFKELLGHAPDTDTSAWPSFYDLIHPDDRDAVRESFAAELRDVSTINAERFHAPRDYRLRRADGSHVAVHAEGISVTGRDGRTVRYICSFIDVTERRAHEDALANRMKFIDDLLDSVPAAVAMRDLDGRFVFVNREFERYFGVERKDMIGVTLRETTLTLWLNAVPASEAVAPIGQPIEVERAEPAMTEDLPALRVLVVDDEYNRLVVRRFLPSPPLTVEAAVNGREALDAAIATPMDVILMDVDMPVMNGFEAATKIREHEQASGRRPCVIVSLTSHDDAETKRRSQDAGCDAFLTKPIAKATLRRTLRELARSRDAAASLSVASPTPAPAPWPDVVDVDPDLKDSVPAFLESRRAAFDDMEKALAEGAAAELRRLGHRLAGSFGLYGFRWASEQARRIERAAEGNDRERLAALIAALRGYVDTVEIRCEGAPVAHDLR